MTRTDARAMMRAPAVLLCSALAACGSAPDRGATPGDPSTRDSAGITIVENRVDLADLPTVRLLDEPRLRIGAIDGPPAYQFFEVTDGLRLEDGRIVIVDGGNQDVRVYDGSGGHLVSFGSAGNGPGEFLRPTGLWSRGDTIELFDNGQQRFSAWTASGELIEVRPLEPRRGGEGFWRFSDGGLLFLELHPRPSGGGFHEIPMTIHRYARDGTLAGTIGEWPWMEYGFIPERGGGPPHFASRTTWAALGDGVLVGTGRAYEVETVDRSGRLERRVRWPGEPREVTEAHLARLRGVRLSTATDNEMRRQMADWFDAFPVADRLPALTDLMPTTDGGFWVREYEGEPPFQPWLVFDADGGLEARIELPGHLRMLEIGPDYILGVEPDEVGVQTVVLYALPFERLEGASVR